MEETKTQLTSAEWEGVLQVLPVFRDIPEIRDHLSVIHLPQGGPLAADGMYIVLRGEVSLSLRGDEIARAKGHEFDYFFEELLALDQPEVILDANAEGDCKLLKLDKRDWQNLSPHIREDINNAIFGDLVNVHMHNFQQPINCCNITATAFGLTALGSLYSTHVDDIFLDCKLPTDYVVNDGMTLGQVFDVACAYIHKKQWKDKIIARCHYFDEELISADHLLNAILESDIEAGSKDILVANFGVGLAHNIDNNGGHFALIAKCNPSTGIIHMVDVHPQKYGKMWITNVDRLYKAMSQRDSGSLRSRGLLRFMEKSLSDTRLDALTRQVSQVDMTDHLDISDDNITCYFRDSTTNLSSISTVALCLRLLGLGDTTIDSVIQATRFRYSEALEGITQAHRLADIFDAYLRSLGVDHLVCERLDFTTDAEQNEAPLAWFRRQMSRINGKTPGHMLFNVDINKIIGCRAIDFPDADYSETAMSNDFWCLCFDYDEASGDVLISDNSCSTSQVWRTSIDNLFEGLADNKNPSLLFIRGS